MKLNRSRTAAIIIVGLTTAATFICLKTKINCRSLFSPRNCLVEHMRKMDPSFKKEDLDKASGSKGEAKPCSGIKRDVFVDGRRLYWGNLGELTKRDGFFATRSSVQTIEAESTLAPRNTVLQQFIHELRSALKAFEKRYCLKINWRKKNLTVPDVTAQFINFWDKDYGRMKDSESKETDNSKGRGK